MMDVVIVFGAFVASAVASERLITRKLQSAFGRVLVVYAVGFALAIGLGRGVDRAAVFVFWTGMVAAWFGVRSHLESSILLQILMALRDGPCARGELLRRCMQYGPVARGEELVRGGFLVEAADGLKPTPKGRLAARVAQRLRS
jgi:hypothetical protein